MSVDLMFSQHTTYKKHNTPDGGDSGITNIEFLEFMRDYPQFTNVKNTYFTDIKYYRNVLKWDEKTIEGIKNIPNTGYSNFILDYDDKRARANHNLHEKCYSYITWNKWISASIYGKENYKEMKMFYDMAKRFNLNLLTYDTIITDSYLEALRIKEENRGIKLTKEQSHVLECIDDQCRWWYVPTDDIAAVFDILGLHLSIMEADITTIIDDVQRENKVAIATFTGHTIIFGMHAPYITYPDVTSYLANLDCQALHLQDILNKLSKVFGKAAYFEYNNDDELIASLAWSSKGKFVYGRFSSEGEGLDIFGTQKKAMNVDQKTIIKTAKKLGMTPEDILIGMMKQKMSVRYFTQPDWYIEMKLLQ